MSANQRPQHLEVFGIVKRNERSFWTRIGVAFRNQDGSITVRLEYLPASSETTIQIREPRREAEHADA